MRLAHVVIYEIIVVSLLRVILALISMAALAKPKAQRRTVVIDVSQLNTILPGHCYLMINL